MKEDWAGWLNRFVWAAWGVLCAIHLLTLDSIPAGLHYDEAFNALDALRIGRDGFWPVFLSGNFGREPLMHYLMALSLRLFGNQVWAVRLPAALAWIGSLPAFYWLLREMYPSDRQARLGRWLLAAPIFMSSLWFSITAHYAIRISWFVFMELLFVAALWRVWNTRRTGPAVLAGILGGLCVYTYLPSRLLPILLALALAIGLVARRQETLARWWPLAIIALVALVVAMPLAVHFVLVPEDLVQRVSQVSVTAAEETAGNAPTVEALVDNTVRVAGMFFARGDENPRNDIPERPVFTWPILPLLLLGLAGALRWRKNLRGTFALLWFLVMLLATWLSQGAPSFQRAIGAFPPTLLLVADGGYAIWRGVQATRRSGSGEHAKPAYGRLVRVGVLGLLVAAVAWEGGAGLRAFQEWAAQPSLYFAFDGGLRRVGGYLADLPQQERLYISPLGNPTSLRFYMNMRPTAPTFRIFDGRHALVIRPGEDVTYVVMVQEDSRSERVLPSLFPEQMPQAEASLYDPDGRPLARVYRIPAAARLRAPQFPQDALWTDGVRLSGYDVDGCCSYNKGDTLKLQLWWKLDGQTPQVAWTVFTHLLTPTGNWAAGQDCEPGCGSYPTTAWQPGDVIVDEYDLVIPPTAAAGDYALEIGLYNWQTGQRLLLAGSGADHLTLRSVTIR